MDAGGSKIPGAVQKRRSKTMGALGALLCRSRFASYIFVSEASVEVEGGRILMRFKGPFWRGKVNGA